VDVPHVRAWGLGCLAERDKGLRATQRLEEHVGAMDAAGDVVQHAAQGVQTLLQHHPHEWSWHGENDRTFSDRRTVCCHVRGEGAAAKLASDELDLPQLTPQPEGGATAEFQADSARAGL
jgi:hypothetical protein